MTEQGRPDLSSVARETIRKQSKIILSEEFAGRLNVLAGVMPDSQELATLFGLWAPDVRHIAQKEGLQYPSPSPEWTDFMNSISHQESVQLRRLISSAYSYFDLRTLGDIRDFTLEEVKVPWQIGLRGRAFATLAFRKKEVENLILGL